MTPRDPVRERLLSVSCELFARQGYDGTSVRDITRRARANLGAITYHFGSKEALYHEVIASRVEPLVELVARAAGLPGAPLDRVEAIVRTFLGYVAAHPEMPKLILRELAAERPLPPPPPRAAGHATHLRRPGRGRRGGPAGRQYPVRRADPAGVLGHGPAVLLRHRRAHDPDCERPRPEGPDHPRAGGGSPRDRDPPR